MKLLSLIVFCSLILAYGCKNDDDNDPAPNNPTSDVASGSVSSTDSAHIVTPDGAYIDVPRGAVPLTIDSSVGTMIFSIERIDGEPQVVNPPDGFTRVENTYRFGPEGFVFEVPVEIAIPVEGTYNIGQIMLARINPTTRVPEFVSADYDPDAGVIRAQTQEMSEWTAYQGGEAFELLSWGRIRVSPTFTPPDQIAQFPRVSVCAESFVPRYPSDTLSVGRISTGAILNGRSRIWTVPQGTYTFCITFAYYLGESSRSINRSYTLPNVVVENDEGWFDNPGLYNFTMTIDQSHYDAATPNSICSCVLQSTPAPGTGELQVTLTWYNAYSCDLDLWVTDPAGEKCYYGNTHSSSGGVLDRDNLCSNYVNGRPENIFWATAPNGIYTVEVNWYSNCGHDESIESQSFGVRIAGSGLTPITEIGEVYTVGQTVRVGQYELSGGTLRQLPGEPVITYHEPSREPKIQRN